MFFYWKGILVSEEILAECAGTIEKIQNRQFTGLHFEQLNGHNLFSVRAADFGNKRRHRLLFTIIEWGGSHYLQFAEMSYNHYKDSRFMRNPNALKRFRIDARKQLASGAAASSSREDATRLRWEAVNSEETLERIKKATRHAPSAPLPMQWYADRPLVLDKAQQDTAAKLTLPLLFTGLPGSGKTSTILLSLPELRHQYPRIVCITRSMMLRNDMQSAWNALPQAVEPGASVEFLTYREWAESCGLDLTGKQEVGEEAFIEWYLKHAQAVAKRLGYDPLPKLLEPLKSRDKKRMELHQREEARAVYQEGRIASGCADKEAYKNLGKRLSTLAPKSLERAFVWDIILSHWVPNLAAGGKIDLSFVRIDPPVCGGLVWLDEAQDVSGAQLENIAKFAGRGLPLVLCAGDFQRLSDPLPFTKPIRAIGQTNGEGGDIKVTQIALPGSYRVPLVLEAFMQRIITLAINDLGGLQDKKQVHEFKCSQGKHARPGRAHWLTWEAMDDVLRESLGAFAANNPECVVITHEEYRDEAQARFGEGALVRTIEEIKGMQFETCILYRYLDTLRFAKISESLHGHAASSSGVVAHRPKHGLGNWQNATAFNRLFTACSRVSERLVMVDIEKPLYPAEALKLSLKQTLPENSVPDFSAERRAFGIEDWQACVEQYIRHENLTQARALFLKRCNGTDEAFDALAARLQARVMPLLPEVQAPPIMLPEVVQAPVAARSTDPARAASSLSAPSFFQEAPSGRGRRTRAKAATHENAEATAARKYLQVIFNPLNAQEMLSFTKDPESIEALRTYLTTPHNVLPYITARQLCMQFTKDPNKPCATSLFHWFFKLGDKRHHDFLVDILRCNPGLRSELRQLFITMGKSFEPPYDAGFADFHHAVHNHGMALDESEVLTLLMQDSGLKSRDEFMWAAVRHMPKECHAFCREMLNYPVTEWAILLRNKGERASYWLSESLIRFTERYIDARNKTGCHTLKSYKEFIIEAFRTASFFVEGRAIRDLKEKLPRLLQRQRLNNQDAAVSFLNNLLTEKSATALNEGYLFLSAIRDHIASLPRRSQSLENKIQSAEAFWSLTEKKTEDGRTFLWALMSEPANAHAVTSALRNVPEIMATMTLPRLLKHQAPVGTYGSSSLFAWLCMAGTEDAHHILYDLLCGKNPALTAVICGLLKTRVLVNNFEKNTFDIAWLTRLNRTRSGSKLLVELARRLECSPDFLFLKLHGYVSAEFVSDFRYALNVYDADWERHFTMVNIDSGGKILLAQTLERVKECLSEVSIVAKRRWENHGSLNFEEFIEHVKNDVASIGVDHPQSEGVIVKKVLSKLNGLQPLSLMNIYLVFRSAMLDTDMSPFTFVQGYMRDFCRRFSEDMRRLQLLALFSSATFWENFGQIEWGDLVQGFIRVEAALLFNTISESEIGPSEDIRKASLLKLCQYLPDDFVRLVRNAIELHPENWEQYFERKKTTLQGDVAFIAMLDRTRQGMQQVGSFAAQSWQKSRFILGRSLTGYLMVGFEAVKKASVNSELSRVIKVEEKLKELNPFNLLDVDRIFRSAIRDPDLSPYSYLSGFMRDFCNLLNQDIKRFERLSRLGSKDFWSEYNRIEWGEIAKDFIKDEAVCLYKLITESETILSAGMQEGLLDEARFIENPKAVMLPFLQKVLDRMPKGSIIDRAYLSKFIQALNYQRDGKPVIELFTDLDRIIPEETLPLAGGFAAIMRAVKMFAEKAMRVESAEDILSFSPAASSRP
ncbi:hypothetical protein Lgee_1165 [Legionella geestiana]|uniref:Uncharacterized protein n=1 Tax=Legionella geestiana TaxID=45065 RepID=A0A0W0TVM6_9GAMM|nr:hypothetical protein [Legionella geestiana]KTC99673.1 hypothetical protein Lgee_1165 [Legionella geestiana]QBS13204.1 hypothetical protein E4T54_10875 [Legionella geestiana]STX54274.1 Uncharacterised protein [Legionella geestiana]